ncbi:MAG: glutamine--fructose-6-phosphate transaminase (isomerizing) [Candidatus Pacebacteria bacterium]|nr:glutamine--fructose-6-phosphate transaminase (isomerizing) [Candidatus Paceibacterota bacterium]
MCGIIGYIGTKPALKKVMIGLKRLEPRGYDSFGLAVMNNSEMTVYKKANLEKGFNEFKENLPDDIVGSIGIGHTRWATHGGVHDKNAHPHISYDSSISIVHNGMIENYKELIQKYQLKSFLVSETDSEIIAHMIALFVNQEQLSFKKAFEKTVGEITGSFGLVAISTAEPDKIMCAKLGSDLYIGKANNGYFVASAKSAYHGAAGKGFALEDREICMITELQAEVWNFDGKKQIPKLEKTESDYEDADKDGYPHVMLKEIYEAPEVLRNSLRGRIYTDAGGLLQVKLGGMEPFLKKVKTIDEIIVVACGTAYNAGLFAKVMFEKYANIPVSVYTATEFVDNDYITKKNSTVLAISQSGTTKDTIDAIKKAKRLGLNTLGIVNAVGSEIARITDAGVHNHAGPEYAVASTKALTSQLAIIGLMTVFLGERRSLRLEDKQNILQELSQLPQVIEKQLEDPLYNPKNVAQTSAKFDSGAIIGSNIHSWLSLEAALKVREISYANFMGYPASELKHGNIALVDQNYLILAIGINDTSLAKVKNNTRQVAARDGNIIWVGHTPLDEEGDSILYPYDNIRIFEALLANIQLQRFAYYFADAKGRPIDRPRNLAKTVTVE